MKKIGSFFKIIGYCFIVLLSLPLWVCVMLVGGISNLCKWFAYQVQVLYAPPPSGGVFGNMCRGLKNRVNNKNIR